MVSLLLLREIHRIWAVTPTIIGLGVIIVIVLDILARPVGDSTAVLLDAVVAVVLALLAVIVEDEGIIMLTIQLTLCHP